MSNIEVNSLQVKNNDAFECEELIYKNVTEKYPLLARSITVKETLRIKDSTIVIEKRKEKLHVKNLHLEM